MKDIGDLHCHSEYSDGSATVKQIIKFAKRANITHLSLTDHDTMLGVDMLTKTGEYNDITIIPGVEITTKDYLRNRPVHILCYFPKKRGQLASFLSETVIRRRNAKLAMIKKISKLYPITIDDVLDISKKSASIHETHIMHALANMGYTPTICGELLKELISKNGSCYVPIEYPDVMDTITALHDIAGIPVIAHPGQFNSLELTEELCRKKLIYGIECFHPRNSNSVTRKCCALADNYNLIKTGGSDFHGFYTSRPHPIGSFTSTWKNISSLFELSEKI